MKSKQEKNNDLKALSSRLENAPAAMVVSFNKLSVAKDGELRQALRDAGASYSVVKNTVARMAVEGTPFEGATEHFKGVTAMAIAKEDPVSLAKAVTKFAKDNPDVFKFKIGIVEGRVVQLTDVQSLANLPSKEELISKIMFVINCQAQRIVTVISAVPRNLAIVVKQIGESKGEAAS